MTLRSAILLILAGVSFVGCDESVPLKYSSRAKAQAEGVFARGWLPEIIPPSSRQISMKNDLDLNLSDGDFRFDATHHDAFIGQLARTPSEDRSGFSAYSFEDWIFWISDSKDHCRFQMKLNRDKQSEQGVPPNRSLTPSQKSTSSVRGAEDF